MEMSDLNLDDIIYHEPSDFDKAFTESILFINANSDPIVLIESSTEGYRHFVNLFSICQLNWFEMENKCSFLMENNYFNNSLNILNYLNSISDEFDFDNARKTLPGFTLYANPNKNEKRIFVYCFLFSIMNRIVCKSNKYCFFLQLDKQRLSAVFYLIVNDCLTEKMCKFEKMTLSHCIYSLNFMSKVVDNYKSIWYEINAIELLSKFTNNYKDWNFFVHMIISNVAFDKDIESLTEIQNSMNSFVRNICELVDTIYKRYVNLEFFDDEYKVNIQSEVACVIVNDATVSLTGLLLSLFRLAINNKIKYTLYVEPNFKEALNKIVMGSFSDVEKQYAIQLLVQLSFDDRVYQNLRQDKNLLNFVQNNILKNKEGIKYKKLIKTCEQFIWLLKEEIKEKTKVNDESNNNHTNKHIMISYNTESRELCLRIKKELENAGFSVWIDVNEIHGSSLESMAEAVEYSECVLLCVTEKYRQSNNCQGEAQYAFKRKKPIVPLIMQKGYQDVTGWLGFIIGDKIFVDFTFTKYKFEESIQRLITQINLNAKKKLNDNNNYKTEHMSLSNPEKKGIEVKNDEKAVINWSNEETYEWFLKNEILDVYEELKPINGKLLKQLNQLQLYTPEFFYKSLTANYKLNLKSVGLFSVALNELFIC